MHYSPLGTVKLFRSIFPLFHQVQVLLLLILQHLLLLQLLLLQDGPVQLLPGALKHKVGDADGNGKLDSEDQSPELRRLRVRQELEIR